MYKYSGIIEGIKCEKCEARVEKALITELLAKKVKFEKRSSVSFLTKQVVNEEDWKSAVRKAGYTPLQFQLEKEVGFFEALL